MSDGVSMSGLLTMLGLVFVGLSILERLWPTRHKTIAELVVNPTRHQFRSVEVEGWAQLIGSYNQKVWAIDTDKVRRPHDQLYWLYWLYPDVHTCTYRDSWNRILVCTPVHLDTTEQSKIGGRWLPLGPLASNWLAVQPDFVIDTAGNCGYYLLG